MATRIIYNNEGILVSSGVATGAMFSSGTSGTSTLLQIHRVQSLTYDFSVTRQDVNQFTVLNRIDSIITESPVVNASFNYLLTDGENESKLGLDSLGQNSCISKILAKTQDPKNYFFPIAREGVDLAGDATPQGVVSLGNASISNLTFNFAVGDLPNADVSIQGFNLKFDTGSQNINTPAINIENGQAVSGRFSLPAITAGTGVNIISAIKPGDVTLEANAGIGIALSGANACPVQSVSISIPLARESLNKLGSLFSYAQEPSFPITVTMEVSVYQVNLEVASLSNLLCNDQTYNLRVRAKEPNCQGTGADTMIFDFKGAKLDSESFSDSIGDVAKTVTLSFSTTIGAGQNDIGVFISGRRAFNIT